MVGGGGGEHDRHAGCGLARWGVYSAGLAPSARVTSATLPFSAPASEIGEAEVSEGGRASRHHVAASRRTKSFPLALAHPVSRLPPAAKTTRLSSARSGSWAALASAANRGTTTRYPRHGDWSTNYSNLYRAFGPHAVCNVLGPPVQPALWLPSAAGPVRIHHPVHHLWLERRPRQVCRITTFLLLLHQPDVLGSRLLLCLCCRTHGKLLADGHLVPGSLAQAPASRPQHLLLHHRRIPMDSHQ